MSEAELLDTLKAHILLDDPSGYPEFLKFVQSSDIQLSSLQKSLTDDNPSGFMLQDALPEFENILDLIREVIATHQLRPCKEPTCPLHHGAMEQLDNARCVVLPTAGFIAGARYTETDHPEVLISPSVLDWASVVAHTITSAIVTLPAPGEREVAINGKDLNKIPERLSAYRDNQNLFDFLVSDFTDRRKMVPWIFLKKHHIAQNPVTREVSDIIRRGFISFILAHELSHIIRKDPVWIDVDVFMEKVTDKGLHMENSRWEFFQRALNELKKLRGGHDAEVPYHMIMNFAGYQTNETYADYFSHQILHHYMTSGEQIKTASWLDRNAFCELFELGACAVFPFLQFRDDMERWFTEPNWLENPLHTTHSWAGDLMLGTDHPVAQHRMEHVLARFKQQNLVPQKEAVIERLRHSTAVTNDVLRITFDQFIARADAQETLQSIVNGQTALAEKWNFDLSDENGVGLRAHSRRKLQKEKAQLSSRGGMVFSAKESAGNA